MSLTPMSRQAFCEQGSNCLDIKTKVGLLPTCLVIETCKCYLANLLSVIVTMDRQKTPNEIAFDSCVRRAGGVCLDDVFPGDPKGKKADYFFESENVIAELKRLTRDPHGSSSIKKKLEARYRSWVKAGLVQDRKTPGFVKISTRELPRECAIEWSGILKKHLDDTYVKKANRQIKAIKERLKKPDAKGLLLLLNEENLSYEPYNTFILLHHVFNGGSRSAIDKVILFTSDILSSLPGDRRGFYWIEASTGRADVPKSLLQLLRNEWELELRKKHPDVVGRLLLLDATPEALEQLKHLRGKS